MDKLGEDISFLQVSRNAFLTGRWKVPSGAMEEKKGRSIGMPLFTCRWLRRAAIGQSLSAWAVRTMQPPFSLEDLVHGRLSEMEVSVLELNLGFACEDLMTWNLASKDERDGMVSSPRHQQPQKAQQVMAQVATSNGLERLSLDQRVRR